MLSEEEEREEARGVLARLLLISVLAFGDWAGLPGVFRLRSVECCLIYRCAGLSLFSCMASFSFRVAREEQE